MSVRPAHVTSGSARGRRRACGAAARFAAACGRFAAACGRFDTHLRCGCLRPAAGLLSLQWRLRRRLLRPAAASLLTPLTLQIVTHAKGMQPTARQREINRAPARANRTAGARSAARQREPTAPQVRDPPRRRRDYRYMTCRAYQAAGVAAATRVTRIVYAPEVGGVIVITGVSSSSTSTVTRLRSLS